MGVPTHELQVRARSSRRPRFTTRWGALGFFIISPACNIQAAMPLSWNEIRNRATNFAREWSGAHRENAEAQTFWNDFFEIFGIRRRTVASFEEPVRNLGGSYDRIDLFWKGRLIAEHKSLGRDLAKAHTQALGYIQGLQNEGRGEEAPRLILVSDFARFALHDLEAEEGQRETHAIAITPEPM